MVVHRHKKHEKARVSLGDFYFRDNGGRRSRLDRRRFSYAGHVPERRIRLERRTGPPDRRSNKEQRIVLDQRYNNQSSSLDDWRSGADRRGA